MGCISSSSGKSPHGDEGRNLNTYDIPKDGSSIDSRRVSTTDNLSKDNKGSAILYNNESSTLNSKTPIDTSNHAYNNSIPNESNLAPIVYNASDNLPFGSIFGDAKVQYTPQTTENNTNNDTNNDTTNNNIENNANNTNNNTSNNTEELPKTDLGVSRSSSSDGGDGSDIKNIYYWCLKLQDINAAMINSHTRDVYIGIIKESIFETDKDKLLNRHFLYNENNENNNENSENNSKNSKNTNGYAFSPKTGKLYTVYPLPKDEEDRQLVEGSYYKWEEKDSMLEFVLDYNQRAIFYRVLNNENEQLFEYNPTQYKEKLKQFNKQNKQNNSNHKKSNSIGGEKHKYWVKLFDNIELCNYRFAITLKGNDYIKLSLINPLL